MRLRLTLASLLFPLSLAVAQLPEIAGYKATTLHQNLSLPVEVIGEGVSEQPSPVVIYLPSNEASAIEGSRNALPLPGLPKQAHGYQLMVLKQTMATPLNLRDGRIRESNIPLFAYVPNGSTLDPVALEAEYFSEPEGLPAEPLRPALASVIQDQPAVASQIPFAAPSMTRAQEVTFLPKDVPSEQSVPAVFEPNATVETVAPKTWDEVLADGTTFSDSMTVGQVILDDRQQLRNRMPVKVEFLDRPLSEVILSLAASSKIDFTIGSLPAGDPHVTTRFNAAPFAALEQIARQHGVGLYKDDTDPLWAIRKVDPEALIHKEYLLSEIHLGRSSGASGDQSFGAGLENLNGANGSGSSSSSGSSNRNNSRRTSSASGTQSGGGSNTGFDGSSTGTSDRFDEPSDVLFTIKSILGLVENTAMTSELIPTVEGETPTQRLTTRPNTATGTNRINGLVSYNAESNSLFVVGTERQHQWVTEYLKVVDRPVVEIAVDALFVESDVNPNEKIGVDWSNTAVDWKVGTENFDLGTLGNLKLPSGAIVSSDGISASLNAFISESKSRVARYPRVVTHNNREVRIATTTNIPIITQASTVAGAVPASSSSTTPGAGDSSGTIQTNFSSGTQEIGTIITILPSRVGKDKVYVKISIEISSGESRSAGEELTGRIPTTSTVYEGEIMIPNGKTLAIGGLERIAETSGIGRVPGLSKVPVFGFLFKKKETNFQNTNITLFLTPRILDLNKLPQSTTRQQESADLALTDSKSLETKATTTKKKLK